MESLAPTSAKRKRAESQDTSGTTSTDELRSFQEHDKTEDSSISRFELSYHDSPPATVESNSLTVPSDVSDEEELPDTAEDTLSNQGSTHIPTSIRLSSVSAGEHHGDPWAISSRAALGSPSPAPPLAFSPLIVSYPSQAILKPPITNKPLLATTRNDNAADGDDSGFYGPSQPVVRLPPLDTRIVSRPPPLMITPKELEPVLATTKEPALPDFPKTPKELRLLIWAANLSDARVVVLYAAGDRLDLERNGESGPRPPSLCVPVVIGPHVSRFVNAESRGQDASRIFSIQRSPSSVPTVWKTWMDPSRDWLCIDPWDGAYSGLNPDSAHVRFWYSIRELAGAAQNIAILDRNSTAELWQWLIKTVLSKAMFPQVKRLGMVRHYLTISAPPERAWAAGLFHHGDSHALVHISDTVRLRKFYDFYLTRSLYPRRSDTIILEMLLNRHTLLGYERWARKTMHRPFEIARVNMAWSSSAPASPGAGHELRGNHGAVRQEPNCWPSEAHDSAPADFPDVELLFMFRLRTAELREGNASINTSSNDSGMLA